MRRKSLLLLSGFTMFYITLVSAYLIYLNTEYPLYKGNERIAEWSTYLLLFSLICFFGFIIYVKNKRLVFTSIITALIFALITPSILIFYNQVPEHIQNLKKKDYDKEIHAIDKVLTDNHQLNLLHLYKDESIRLSKQLEQISVMLIRYENEITKSETQILMKLMPYNEIRIIMSDEVGDIEITTDKYNNISKCEPVERCISLNLLSLGSVED